MNKLHPPLRFSGSPKKRKEITAPSIFAVLIALLLFVPACTVTLPPTHSLTEALASPSFNRIALREEAIPSYPAPLEPRFATAPRSLMPGFAETVKLPLEAAVTYYETTISLPTYPYQQYQSSAIDPATRWPYKVFDRERYETATPSPENKTYRLIVIENEYLQLLVLPELGGRLWQIVHKASENRLFYQNNVVKPSPWGPQNQLGWTALGGLEWNLPVIEHGYDWGSEWWAVTKQHSPQLVSVTLETPRDGRLLHASVTVWLQAGMASVTIEPSIVNVSDDPLQFDYWHSAMLAPGPENSPSSDLHFVLPASRVMIHSTGDQSLPPPGESITWPIYRNRDLSVLGNWEEYLGLFEHPSARGPFVGIYDRAYNAGGVRIFPPATVPGSKLFGLGWHSALSNDYFTDDGSAYVEIHGGLSPTFFEKKELSGGEKIEWRENWYPVQGIGDLVDANEIAAINLNFAESVLSVGLYTVIPVEGTLSVINAGVQVAQIPVRVGPTAPFSGIITNVDKFDKTPLQIVLQDMRGQPLLKTNFQQAQ